MLLEDFPAAAGASLTFGPADDDRGDFKGSALFLACPLCDTDLSLRFVPVAG